MTGEQGGTPDDLRRRLYAPGATDEDVVRYRDLAGPEPEPESPGPEAEPQPEAPHAVRRRALLLGAGGVAAVVAVAVTGIALGGSGSGTPTPLPTTPRAAPAPEQTILPIAVFARAGFVRALDAGGDAGLLPFFLNNPDARPDAIRTVTRASSDEYHGIGADTIALDPSALAERGGRMTVLLVVDQVDKFEWRATRLAMTNDRSGPEVPVARRFGVLQPGEVGTATIAYTDGAPTSVLVLVDDDVRWGAVVVFTD